MAKAAGEGASSPALTASSSKSVEEDGQREQQGAEKVEEKKQLNKKELEVTVSAAVPIKQVQKTHRAGQQRGGALVRASVAHAPS